MRRAANPFPPGTYAHRRHQEWVEAMVNEPAFVQYLIQKSRSVPAGTDAATYGATLMATIVKQGLPRIPDELLERYYVADMSMLRTSTTAQCAAIAQSRLSTKDRHSLLGRLPDDALDAYYDALEAAIGQEIGTASSTRLTPAQAEGRRAETGRGDGRATGTAI